MTSSLPETSTSDNVILVKVVEEEWVEIPVPDVSHLVTEDDTPVDNLLSEKQQRLLINSLYSSLLRDEPFLAAANVGLYYGVKQPAIVPDVLLSLGVSVPEDWSQKQNRSYFVWQFGKPPEVVIEIVSNTVGNELGSKLEDYAQARVAYYVVFDPLQCLDGPVLRVYELHGTRYRLLNDNWMDEIELGVTLWEGTFEEKQYNWLRWCDRAGILLTGDERANTERQRADAERQRAERLAQLLRARGIDPDEVLE